MNALAIHPDPKELRELTRSIRAVHPDWKVAPFNDQMLAVKHGFNNQVDVLYTFVRMRPLDGFAVARMLRERYPELPVNFISADEGDRTDALRFGVNSYTISPVTPETLRTAEAEEW
ncbi:MAG: response regulator [Bacillota bacterium]|nr:response regulator [Bacillota bacterium]